MDSRETNADDRERELEREIAQYRQAATQALAQLEACVDYLYRAGKPDVARTLGRNRNKILERLP
jgi:hypothetical protein